MSKRILACILVLLFTIGSYPISVADTQMTKTEQAKDPLPSAVTLVGTKHLPPIGNQGAVGCCASMAATYMQFTNAYSRYLHSIDPSSTFDPSSGSKKYNFSPRFTYNLAGAGTAWVYEVLKEQGTPLQTYSSFSGGVTGAAADDTLAKNWATYDNYWTAAMQYRISHYDQVWMSEYNFQLTTTNKGKDLLNRIKSSLNAGNVVVTGGYPDRWDYTTVINGGTYGQKGQQVIYRSTNRSSGGHQVSIVGYDDDLTCTVNGITLKGAFLVANSWGTTWKNDGYTWIMYDAINQSSAYTSLNHANRQWTLDQFVFVDWKTDLAIGHPDLMAKIQIKTDDRNGFSVTLTRTDTKGNIEKYTPYIIRNENLMPNYNKGLNFNGQTGTATGYLTFNYGPLLDIPKGKSYDDYVWGMTVCADSGKTLTVSGVQLLGSDTSPLYTVDQSITLTDGKEIEYAFSDLCIVNTDLPEGIQLNTVSGTTVCKKGSDYQFTLNTLKGYNADHLCVMFGEEEIYPLDGIYSVTVKENTTLSISGITRTNIPSFDITWYGSGFENWSGKFLMLPTISNSYLDPNIYALEAQLSAGNYPYFFRITVDGVTYCFKPHSFYQFSDKTLYRLAVVDGGWIPKNKTSYTLKIEFCSDTQVLYTATEQVTCGVSIEQAYTTHTHTFQSGRYQNVLLPDCTHEGSLYEYCSYNHCSAVLYRQNAPNTNRHTSRYSETLPPTCLSEGSYTVHCEYCHKVLYSEPIPKLPAKTLDIDDSGSINISDVNEMLAFLSSAQENESAEKLSRYDVNKDGYVNVSDLNDLLTYLANI